MFGLPVEQQLMVFLYFYAAGLITGLVFDFFKASAKVFNFSKRIVFFLDLILCLLASFIVYYVLFLLNYGEVRLFVFLALLSGLLFYYLIISGFIYRNLLVIFRALRSIIYKILKLFNILQDFILSITNYLGQRITTYKALRGKK
ncbi:MAG: spore cortex biosynthesis protein YabQ [Dethiobacteria bacterium]|jgi:spore cortex biosynthesis protein YabQ